MYKMTTTTYPYWFDHKSHWVDWTKTLLTLPPTVWTDSKFKDYEVEQTDKEVTYYIEVMGFAAEEIKMSVDNNRLTVKCEKKEKPKFGYQSFMEVIDLPKNADAENAKCTLANGILTIAFPLVDKSVHLELSL